MEAEISMWGNSLALRIPALLAKDLSITSGSKVDLTIKGGKIIIKPKNTDYLFDELIAGVTDNNMHNAVEFSPTGKEKL